MAAVFMSRCLASFDMHMCPDCDVCKCMPSWSRPPSVKLTHPWLAHAFSEYDEGPFCRSSHAVLTHAYHGPYCIC